MIVLQSHITGVAGPLFGHARPAVASPPDASAPVGEGENSSLVTRHSSLTSIRPMGPVRPILPLCGMMKAGDPDFWIQDSKFPLRAFAPWREKFGSFCQKNLDSDNQPLNWGKNGLSHPQFNPPARSKSFAKPPETRPKSQLPTIHQPPQTKKLNATVESGCRPGAPALPASAKQEPSFCSPWSFSGAWRLGFGCFFLQPSKGFSNHFQPSKGPLPPRGGGGVPGRNPGYITLSSHEIFLPGPYPLPVRSGNLACLRVGSAQRLETQQ
jgi:hypothetical protein